MMSFYIVLPPCGDRRLDAVEVALSDGAGGGI
jgi:hypothetical protein